MYRKKANTQLNGIVKNIWLILGKEQQEKKIDWTNRK